MRDKKYLLNLSREARMEREKFLEQSREVCPFCAMIERRDNPRRADVVLETSHFVTIIDIAPPTEFYFVTFPKEHTLAYYEVNTSIEREFNAIVELLIARTGRDNFVFFENGAGNRKDGTGHGVVSNQSVYHAHVNMVFLPERISMIDKITDRFNALNVPHVTLDNPYGFFPTHDIRRVTLGAPYFYVRQGRQVNIFMEEREKIVPSQFVRRCITEVINGDTDAPFWDWKSVRVEEYPILEERKRIMRSLFS